MKMDKSEQTSDKVKEIFQQLLSSEHDRVQVISTAIAETLLV